MKTKILSLIALFIITSGISKSTYAKTVTTADYTILKDIRAVNRIEVRGNVELFISDDQNEQVKVYNKYYAESALVQSANGVLRITSYNPEKLVVWVSMNDLRSVSAYDNAEVRSFGKLSKIEFNIDLHNYATANLNLDAYSANVNVADHAKADLTGTATEFTLNHDKSTSVNKYNFTAAHYIENKTFIPAPEMDELVGI